MAYFLACDSI